MKNNHVDMSKVIAFICGVGDIRHLLPLTLKRSLQAVPFGGCFRLVDIPLSNLLNSHASKIIVAAQWQPQALISHIQGFQGAVAHAMGQYIQVVQPTLQRGSGKYFASDAHSLLQLRDRIEAGSAEYILVVMSDQILRIDYRQVLQAMKDADAAAAAVFKNMEIEEAEKNSLDCILHKNGQVSSIVSHRDEKVREQSADSTIPANLACYAFCRQTFSSMLNYIAKRDQPMASLARIGIPWLIQNYKVLAYDFSENEIPGNSIYRPGFFAKVGSVDDWFDIQMGSCTEDPAGFNLKSKHWPILTSLAPRHDRPGPGPSRGGRNIDWSEFLVGPNVMAGERSFVRSCVLSNGVEIGKDCRLTRCVILDTSVVEDGCSLDGVVIDQGVVVPEGLNRSSLTPPSRALDKKVFVSQFNEGTLNPSTSMMTNNEVLVYHEGFEFPPDLDVGKK